MTQIFQWEETINYPYSAYSRVSTRRPPPLRCVSGTLTWPGYAGFVIQVLIRSVHKQLPEPVLNRLTGNYLAIQSLTAAFDVYYHNCQLPPFWNLSNISSRPLQNTAVAQKNRRTGYRDTQSHDLNNIHKTCHLHLLRQQAHEVRPPRRASHVRLADETAKPVALQRNGRFFVRKAGAPAGPSVAAWAKRRCLLPAWCSCTLRPNSTQSDHVGLQLHLYILSFNLVTMMFLSWK